MWATDLWFSASENLRRIRDAGVEDGVFPIHSEARALPFVAEFFDAVISLDAFSYFGTDDLYLRTPDLWCLHSAEWWKRHWARTGILEVTTADTMPDGWRLWLDWHKLIAPDNAAEIQALELDRGRYLGYNRVVGRRLADVHLEEPVVSVPTEYVRKPLLSDRQ